MIISIEVVVVSKMLHGPMTHIYCIHWCVSLRGMVARSDSLTATRTRTPQTINLCELIDKVVHTEL